MLMGPMGGVSRVGAIVLSLFSESGNAQLAPGVRYLKLRNAAEMRLKYSNYGLFDLVATAGLETQSTYVHTTYRA